MSFIERSALIAAPVEEVFRRATDVSLFHEWLTFDGTPLVLECRQYRRCRIKLGGALPKLIHLDFLEMAGRTRLHLLMEYAVPGRIVGALVDKLFVERAVERAADRALEWIEAGFATRAPAPAPQAKVVVTK